MEPLVSIFQLQDADRSPVLAHIHRLHQEGKFKEVSEPFPVALGLFSTGRASTWVSGVGESRAGGESPTLEVSPLPWGLCRGRRSGVQGTSPPGPAQVHAWRGGPGCPHTDPLRALGEAPTSSLVYSTCQGPIFPGAQQPLTLGQQRGDIRLWPRNPHGCGPHSFVNSQCGLGGGVRMGEACHSLCPPRPPGAQARPWACFLLLPLLIHPCLPSPCWHSLEAWSPWAGAEAPLLEDRPSLQPQVTATTGWRTGRFASGPGCPAVYRVSALEPGACTVSGWGPPMPVCWATLDWVGSVVGTL